MTPHDLVEAALERGGVERAGQAHGGGEAIGAVARRELVEEPQSLLIVGERVLAGDRLSPYQRRC